MLLPKGVQRNISLAPFAAYKVGGAADYFFEASTEIELVKVIDWAFHSKIPYFVLGSGSNLLIRDTGFRGLVIYVGPLTRSWKIELLEGEGRFRVPAAFSKAELLDFALMNGWSGLEFSAGIPGTLGGAVYMNAGTRWGSYESVIESVRLWIPKLGIVEKPATEMGFKYRGHGEGALSKGAIVLSVDIKLQKSSDNGSLSFAMVDRILSYRGARQALERPSCGSVFKNPEGSSMGAGRLIEAANLKGQAIGGAQISTKHANFILNTGEAKAKDIEDLVEFIQKTIFEKYKIELELELIIIGQ